MSNPPVPIGWNIQEIPGSSGSVTTHIVDITPRVEICEHHKKKKHRRHSSSSSCDSSSSSSSSSSGSSSSGGNCKKHSKHHHHHDHKDKKLHKKDKKHKSRHEKHEAKKLHKIEKHERKKAGKEEHRLKKMAKKSKHHGDVPDCGVPIELMSSNAFVPETKEQYEARQRIVRRVLDEETGRYRLIKGDGEVLEEIVSEKRHKEINRQATAGDGSFFEKKTLGKLSR